MSYASIYSDQLLKRSPVRTNSRSYSNHPSTNHHHLQHSLAPETGSPIIVHSHLCWDWVWQRPQQFVSRLSRKHRVLFVETVAPAADLATVCARFRHLPDFPRVTLLRLQFPEWFWSDGQRVDRERRHVLQQVLAGPLAGEFQHPVQWFYDPMAVTSFAGHMGEILTVYDCMDELSKFACAPAAIKERELRLLAQADVVFTGGRRLYESKRRFNSNCHFYGCGVEVEHFGSARSRGTQVPDDLDRLQKPVLGYFGVIDERLDYELIVALAEANREWSIAMVGPVMKVDESKLPQRPNLHWLGKRPYEDLPALCRGFDVCLMPFALNEATEFINPTKALEYMATGRPIVSSAIADVVANFSSVVKIAHSPTEFVTLCRTALDQPDQAAIERGFEMAAANSWDSIVLKLEQHMEEALARKHQLKEAA